MPLVHNKFPEHIKDLRTHHRIETAKRLIENQKPGLTRGNLVAEDNARTALVMYQELVGQIITRGAEFQKAGVEREELESALLEIRKRLGTDFGELSDAEQKAIAAEKQELTDMLRKAERLLESVYGGRKSGG